MRELDIEAPAKINLFLAVLGKRADGYHTISSAMQKVDLSDQLHLSRAGQGISLRCPASTLPEDSSNIAYKAAIRFFEHTGIPENVQMTLHKRIPVAAGLGGGSSDAAAVLLGLNRLYDAGLSNETLQLLAANLGADVPFFVNKDSTALATGTGTDLKSFSGPLGYWLVLVNPGFSVSTRWVYENLTLTTDNKLDSLTGSLQSIDSCISLLDSVFSGSHSSHRLFNDLEAVTITRFPEIQAIKDDFNNGGAIASLMSGSGPTVFGVFREYDMAQKSFARFSKRFRDVFLVNPLN